MPFKTSRRWAAALLLTAGVWAAFTAEVWLAENPHFAKAPAGGSGGKGPNAGNGRGSVPLADRPASDLIGSGWSREPPTR